MARGSFQMRLFGFTPRPPPPAHISHPCVSEWAAPVFHLTMWDMHGGIACDMGALVLQCCTLSLWRCCLGNARVHTHTRRSDGHRGSVEAFVGLLLFLPGFKFYGAKFSHSTEAHNLAQNCLEESAMHRTDAVENPAGRIPRAQISTQMSPKLRGARGTAGEK